MKLTAIRPFVVTNAQQMDSGYRTLTKTILVMKITAILLLVAFLQVSARGYTQESITISMKNVSLEKIFSAIKKQTNYSFFYDHALIQNEKTVTIDIKNASVEGALKASLKDLSSAFEIKD